MSREDGRWVADSSLGPRMRKSVEKVLSSIKWEGSTFYEAHRGFLGDPVDPDDLRFATTAVFLGVGPGTEHPDKLAHLERAKELELAIKEEFSYTLTKANYKEVIEAYADTVKELAESRPVIDERRTRDEDADLKVLMTERSAKDAARRDELAEIQSQVEALAPAGTQSVIVAQLKEDMSDSQTDYFANKTLRTVVIGFSHKTREDFRELHAAAASFPETAHLADGPSLTAWLEAGNGWGERGCGYVDDHAGEHRDNYSMGSGNYLSDHGYDGSGSGWRVSRTSLKGGYPSFTEIAEGLREGVSA